MYLKGEFVHILQFSLLTKRVNLLIIDVLNAVNTFLNQKYRVNE